MAGQQAVLLSPKIPLVTDNKLMAQEWYAFLASKLKLFGEGTTSIDDVLVLLGAVEEVPTVLAMQALQQAEDNAVLLAFAG